MSSRTSFDRLQKLTAIRIANSERQALAFVLSLAVGKLSLICGCGYRLKADATEGDVEFPEFP